MIAVTAIHGLSAKMQIAFSFLFLLIATHQPSQNSQSEQAHSSAKSNAAQQKASCKSYVEVVRYKQTDRQRVEIFNLI